MDTNFLKKNLIAHRGLHDKDIPENSIPAFKKAMNKNYIIELDTHLLKDGNVVVFHDDNLKRMTGIDNKIKDKTYDEIKDLKLLNTIEHIPLLEDVLKLVDGKVPLLIELKYDTKVGLLEDKILSILKSYKGLYVFQSFNPKSVLYLKKKILNIPVGILVPNFKESKMNFIKKILLKIMITFYMDKFDFVSANYNVLNDKKVRKNYGKKLILTWVIRNINDLAKYNNLCDNFIVENITNN